MANVFGGDLVMTVKVERLAEAQARLNRADKGLQPAGIERQMTLAVGMVHRYLMSLSRSGSPGQGILPVATGRLKNSFFWKVERKGGGVIGRVASNVVYGPRVEFGFAGTDSLGRKYNQPGRRFLARTVRDQEKPVNSLLAAHVRQVTG